jgi:hypothetical protein
MIARWMLAAWLLTLPATSIAAGCPCDCNDDGIVVINELIAAVNVALGAAPVSQCPAVPDCVAEPVCPVIASLVQCINAALSGCPAAPTPTLGPGSATLAALVDAVAPDICAGVLSTPGGGISIATASDTGEIRCNSSIGHSGWVRLTRYASAGLAAATFGEATPDEDVNDVGGGVLRNVVSVELPYGHTTQDWRWLRGCWIATGHAFDDTSYRFAPQPHASVSRIAASPLFADLLAQCADS